MSEPTDPAYREPAVRRYGRAILAAIVAAGLVIGLATLLFVAHTASEAKRSADAIEDCTTPGGGCYQRGQDGTARAVKQITDDLDRLEAQRALTSAQIIGNLHQVQAILTRLCADQRIDCR